MAQGKQVPYGGPFGRRLLVNVVDETAKADPDRTWIYVPRSSDESDGWKALTWRQHANAVNRTANWLVEQFGKPAHKSFPSLAYVGTNDARYLILFSAGVKAGYQVGTHQRSKRSFFFLRWPIWLTGSARSCSRPHAITRKARFLCSERQSARNCCSARNTRKEFSHGFKGAVSKPWRC